MCCWVTKSQSSKVSFPVLGLFEMTYFKFNLFYFFDYCKKFQQVRPVHRNELTKFGYDIISIDWVMTSQNYLTWCQIWWRHISVIDIEIALKLWSFSYHVVATICNNLWSFYKADRDLQNYRHLWRHWRLIKPPRGGFHQIPTNSADNADQF